MENTRVTIAYLRQRVDKIHWFPCEPNYCVYFMGGSENIQVGIPAQCQIEIKKCDRCGQAVPQYCTCRDGYFFDRKAGVFMTFNAADIKIALIRALMKLVTLFVIFVLYVTLWGIADTGILILTMGSCAGTFLGINFLSISCWGGFLACLVRGVSLGSDIASITIHWKVWLSTWESNSL
jgi:hypothetical protein